MEMCLCVTITQIYGERANASTVWIVEVFPECADFRAISHQPWDRGVKQTRARINPNSLLVSVQGQRESKKQKQREIEKNTQEARGMQNKTIIIFALTFFLLSAGL